ncbi:MAG: hypothetical protein K5739_03380 [Lachnospiraceae bacterium]|nr:hypothetical protein [Lachnospiraceae bacterium]
MMKNRRFLTWLGAAMIFALVTGCASEGVKEAGSQTAQAGPTDGDETAMTAETDDSNGTDQNTYDERMENNADGEHVLEADGTTEEYANLSIEKTGDSDGDEADFYGENSAVFATNAATLTLSGLDIHTNGTHANAVFSYGEGTTVTISASTIETEGNCSGGIMTTGGGTINAENLTIHTSGRSSAAIRSDRGGGTVNVTGGSYTTDGIGSPAIYSTADITVSDADLTSTASEGIVVEGKNSVTLNNVTLSADNNQTNSDKSGTYKAVMIYQSMSGDAAQGTASFTMNGGSLTNENGDVFFVNNTVADIRFNNAFITNNGDGVFLRAEAAGWGKEGSNGGHVNMYAANQSIDGNMIVDDISTLNLYLSDGSSFTGTINTDGAKGSVYVELKDGSTWTLTGDSHIGSLTCQADSINLNGHKLYVDGKEYEEGTALSGEAFKIEASTSDSGDRQASPDGEKPELPEGFDKSSLPEGMEAPPDFKNGEKPEMPDGERPEKPSGDMKNPPEKPSGDDQA